MNLAIFIAGEAYRSSPEEFPLYCDWFKGKPYPWRLATACPQDECSDGDLLAFTDVSEGQEFTFLFSKLAVDYAVVVIKKNDFLKSFTTKLNQSQGEFEVDEVEAILKTILCDDVVSLADEALDLSLIHI